MMRSMFRPDLLTGRRILVTGGGSGLGRAMAETFAGLGADLVICGRRKGMLEETAAAIIDATGRTCDTYAVDIRDAEAVDAMVADCFAKAPLTDLVNNAAGNFISRTEDMSHRGFDAIANIVFHGTFYCTHSVGRRWIEHGMKGNVLSIVVSWVWTGSPFVVPSAMSKAGIATMTQSLAVEWGPKGIRLNAIAPGVFPTEGMSARLNPTADTAGSKKESTIPLRRVGDHPEFCNLAAFLLADEVAYLTGEVIAIDGGRWLNTAGSFGNYADLTDEQWQEIRDSIKKITAKDKAAAGS